MFENQTYENIMQRMLSHIPNDVDKREGSIIWDALSPAALELELAYIDLDDVLNEGFADTNTRPYLIRRCAERGITPYPATNAVLQGEFTPNTVEVLNQRFTGDTLTYVATEKISNGVYKLTCETAGIAGGQYLGDITPINYIDSLETATLTALLIPGEDEEATEALRTRYFADASANKAFGGNVQDYLDETNALDGVGACKVTPIWNGAGTVKLTILNSDYDKASATLIASVQAAIDPSPQGEGRGIAPIGHTVTVDAPGETTINVTVEIEFDTGYGWNNLQTAINEMMTEYLLELRQAWATAANVIVRVAQIETRLLTITGIVDVSGTTINGTAANLTIDADKIPVFGVITSG